VKLNGKVALITGAGQGVGQGIALAMVAQGARIAVTGRFVATLCSDDCAYITSDRLTRLPY
jgi:NAD(P)-dependent dehydrogenase (short-subunit alcohol dehydrogenase family)